MSLATFRTLGFSFSLLLALAAQAQPKEGVSRPGHGGSHGHMPNAATAAYVQERVLPVLRQQRRQLEDQLAPADQATLAACRARLAEVRPQMEALHQRRQAAYAQRARHEAASSPSQDPHYFRPSSRSALSEEQWQQLGTLQRQESEIFDQVQGLLRQYLPVVEQHLRQLAPQHERWANDLLALQPAPPASAPAGYRPDWHHVGPLVGMLRPLSFLLLEPAAAPELRGTMLYPNPATAASQLQIEVKQTGPVRVELLDAQGQPLRPLLPETTRLPGTFTQPLDLSGLAPGTYYYQVTTAAGSEVKRFVKE